ncbi:C4-dicarboxylate ABC transporter substrate-binding protein [Variovorax terrae]|uniref:C4-dicarboxylate ABC transporter substrate-binding protein n=1 Tax=Variovorax terrae TaxID=2923278 RepID=A0A9X1VWM2_9BURK|nr:C4-dicarboxylate ABC transporter substrate-binding protein [Variovorax terrae]MCJ0763424.1 C4-dicarboxylate ABC transporter substrate-binding protein [Variovorax terrae]
MMRRLCLAASLLVLPLALLLFAQWPLRDGVQAGSRLANDAAQILFALYVAVAVTAASRARLHLSALKPVAPGAAPARWRRWALLACLAPWSLYLLWVSTPMVWDSLRQMERFAETLTPGYFLIKLALWLMALLVLVDALASLRGGADDGA